MKLQSLTRLHDLVPPPELPTCAGHPNDVTRISSELKKLGYQLPNELYELSLSYGRGWFVCNGFSIAVHSVFQEHYLSMVEFNQRVYDSSAINHPNDLTPWATMFELGGCGYSDNDCSVLFLDMAGEESQWTVGVSRPFQRFTLGVVDFFVQLFSNELSPQGFPSSFAGTSFVSFDSV